MTKQDALETALTFLEELVEEGASASLRNRVRAWLPELQKGDNKSKKGGNKPNRQCAGSAAVGRCTNEAEFDGPDEQCPWCYNSDQNT